MSMNPSSVDLATPMLDAFKKSVVDKLIEDLMAQIRPKVVKAAEQAFAELQVMAQSEYSVVDARYIMKLIINPPKEGVQK